MLGLRPPTALLLGADLAPTDPVLAGSAAISLPRDTDRPDELHGRGHGLICSFAKLGSAYMFEWLRAEHRERRKKIKLDRQHLEARARRFLRGYLEAGEAGKPQYYQAVEDISRKCQPALSLAVPASNDSWISEAAAKAAMKMVLQLNEGLTTKDQADFLTDACATVAIAYHRAAGVYAGNSNMQELGTAAVHLLTMATSYTSAQRQDAGSDQSVLPFGER
jgi:hypothetical protein